MNLKIILSNQVIVLLINKIIFHQNLLNIFLKINLIILMNELIHLPTKYKIIDIKKEVLNHFKNKINEEYDVNYNVITIEEVK